MKIGKKYNIFILIIAAQCTIEGIFDGHQSISADLIKKWETIDVTRDEIKQELDLRVANYNKNKTKEAQQKVWELLQYLNDKTVIKGKNEKPILVPWSKQNKDFCFSSIALGQYAEDVDISASDIYMLRHSRVRLLESNGISPQGGGSIEQNFNISGNPTHSIAELKKTSLTKNTEPKKIVSIIKATYGSGATIKDVTDIVKKMVGNTSYKFAGGSQSMNKIFGDPIPGTIKNLTIEVTYNDGTSESLIIQEDNPFTLSYGSEFSTSPIHKKITRIVEATYGSEGILKNVTGTISEMLKKAPYEFPGGSQSMNKEFGDPIPGTVKYLTIEVAYNDGTFETLKIQEDSKFTLL